jgi:hypothetical protein
MRIATCTIVHHTASVRENEIVTAYRMRVRGKTMKERAWRMRRMKMNWWEKRKKPKMKMEKMVGGFFSLILCTVGHKSFAVKQHSDSSLTVQKYYLIFSNNLDFHIQHKTTHYTCQGCLGANATALKKKRCYCPFSI